MFFGGFGGNRGSGPVNMGTGLSGLGMMNDNIFGSAVRVRGSYDTNSLISGNNMRNIGTVLMLEQLEQMGNRNNNYNNNYNYNNGYNNQQNYPQNNGFSNQNSGYNQSGGFVSANQTPNRINVAQSQSVPQSNVQPQTSSLKPPKRRRPGVANPGAPLMRGQKYAVSGSGKLKIGLGWDIEDSRCELDASAFMLGADGKIVGDEWFIFYGQDTSPDNSVKYKVFDINQSVEDDAEVTIDLAAVDPRAERIVFAITMYEASARRINFGMVKNVYARIMDGTNGKEAARFQLTECYDNVTALVVGELYRYKGTWKFNAVGSGVAKDLAEFCGMYGVVLC